MQLQLSRSQTCLQAQAQGGLHPRHSGSDVEQIEHDPVMSLTVVEIDGEPWWQACSAGICVRDRCGARAQELLRLAQQSHTSQRPGLGSSEVASSSGNT